ncbi:MAG: Ig-like domain-containing protein, partial [Magnetococcus sp. DMHC-6]
ASQTITATLNRTLTSDDRLYGSVDNGTNWTKITDKVSGTTITWTGATLSGSSTIVFKVKDAAGNSSATTGSQSYVLDTTKPTITVTNVDISADTGTSATDFLTNSAAQTITGTLSKTLATGDILFGSVDNGSTWIDITNKVSGTAIFWTGATLSGSNSIAFKVTDAAGNSGSKTGSQAYVLDTTLKRTLLEKADTLNLQLQNFPITGSDRDDALIGSANNDILTGGKGSDMLFGGSGADMFCFNSPNEGQDTLNDFKGAEGDQLVFYSPNFGSLATGILDPIAFIANETGGATNADQRFIFNTVNRILSYDADGHGALSAVNIATLNTSTLTAAQIFMAS